MQKNKCISAAEAEHIINKFGPIGDDGKRLTVNDLSLYQHAFVHKEYLLHPDPSITFIARESWDELEFLGDSVLGYVCAFLVYDDYKGEGEGMLTKLKSAITRGDHIAQYGLELGLYEYMLCSVVMEKNATTNIKYSRYYRDNLEDMFEALLGAIVLDNGGIMNGLRFAQRFITLLIEQFVDLNELHDLDLDPKGSLINFCNLNELQVPVYPKIRIRGHTDTLYGVALKTSDVKKILALDAIPKDDALRFYKLEYPTTVSDPSEYTLLGWSRPFHSSMADVQNHKNGEREAALDILATKKKGDLIQVACRYALRLLTRQCYKCTKNPLSK